MSIADSALDAKALAKARALLSKPKPVERTWPALSAAAFLAVSALVFATAMIVSPPATTTPVEGSR